MGEDRIQKIIQLEEKAASQGEAVSSIRWETAELYWIEYEKDNTPQSEIAKRVGKSKVHVHYMIKCWDIVKDLPKESFPDFQEAYHSPEVRGEAGQDKGGDRKHKGNAPEDFSAHGLAQSAAEAVDSLARNPAMWPQLTDDDIALLRETKDTLRVMIRDIGR